MLGHQCLWFSICPGAMTNHHKFDGHSLTDTDFEWMVLNRTYYLLFCVMLRSPTRCGYKFFFSELKAFTVRSVHPFLLPPSLPLSAPLSLCRLYTPSLPRSEVNQVDSLREEWEALTQLADSTQHRLLYEHRHIHERETEKQVTEVFLLFGRSLPRCSSWLI